MELTEPTRANLLASVDRVLAQGYGYRFLVGATRWGTQLLQEDPEELLPLAEMIPISSSRHVRIWWSMNLANEPMDLLFCAHRATDTKVGTPPSVVPIWLLITSVVPPQTSPLVAVMKPSQDPSILVPEEYTLRRGRRARLGKAE